MASENLPDEVIIYGSSWCPFTVRALQWLEAWNIQYKWVDVDDDPAAEKQIADWNDGRAVRPTFDIGGAIFVNPEQEILKSELESRGLLSDGAGSD